MFLNISKLNVFKCFLRSINIIENYYNLKDIMCVQNKHLPRVENSRTWRNQLSENSGVNRCAPYPRAQRSIGRMQFRIDMQSESHIYVCMYVQRETIKCNGRTHFSARPGK